MKNFLLNKNKREDEKTKNDWKVVLINVKNYKDSKIVFYYIRQEAVN